MNHERPACRTRPLRIEAVDDTEPQNFHPGLEMQEMISATILFLMVQLLSIQVQKFKDTNPMVASRLNQRNLLKETISIKV